MLVAAVVVAMPVSGLITSRPSFFEVFGQRWICWIQFMHHWMRPLPIPSLQASRFAVPGGVPKVFWHNGFWNVTNTWVLKPGNNWIYFVYVSTFTSTNQHPSCVTCHLWKYLGPNLCDVCGTDRLRLHLAAVAMNKTLPKSDSICANSLKVSFSVPVSCGIVI